MVYQLLEGEIGRCVLELDAPVLWRIVSNSLRVSSIIVAYSSIPNVGSDLCMRASVKPLNEPPLLWRERPRSCR